MTHYRTPDLCRWAKPTHKEKWWSGQHKRVVHGIDVVLWLIVIGDGHLVVPIDFVGCRPNPQGPGARCRDKLTWAKVMLDKPRDAWARRGLELLPTIVVLV